MLKIAISVIFLAIVTCDEASIEYGTGTPTQPNNITIDTNNPNKSEVLLWEDRTLYYEFHENLDEGKKKLFEQVVDYLKKRTCLRFVKQVSESLGVIVKPSDTCNSPLGVQSTKQTINFGCDMFGDAVRVVMRTLGLDYIHRRSDRAAFLDIDDSQTSDSVNLSISDDNNTVPFEYGSVLMLPISEFPNNALKITNQDYEYTIGNRRIAFYDIKALNNLYGCKCWVKTPKWCAMQGYPNPADCSTCICAPGFSGDTCEYPSIYDINSNQPDRHTTDQSLLLFTDTWKTMRVEFGFSTNPEEKRANFFTHNLLFERGLGAARAFQFQILDMEGFDCERGCNSNGIEVKFKADPRIVNPLICCNNNNFWNRTFEVTGRYNFNTTVSLYTRVGVSSVQFRYRYDAGKRPTTINYTTNGFDNQIYENF